MKQILDFLNSLEVDRIAETGTGRNENILYKHFRKKKLCGNTEQWFKEVSPGIIGRIDLLGNGTIYDYKTSGKRSPSTIVKSSVLSMLKKKRSTDADFQTPMYLLYLSKSAFANDFSAFCYLYPLDAKSEFILGEEVSMSKSLVRFIPKTISNYMLSREVYETACEKSKAAGKLTYEQWKEFVEVFSERLETGDEVHEDVERQFHKLITEDLGLTPGDFNRKTEETFHKNEIKSVSSLFKDIRTPRGKDGLIFLNDIEETEEYIKGALVEMNEFAGTDFPCRPAFDKRKVCNTCDYLGICTGNKLWEGTSDESFDAGEENLNNNN
jgi:CRISPR/Cas system-associated exonuclease Cas4 (RecB family)